MKRRQISELIKWHNEENCKPLILRGARQVGKTTLVRIFCKEQGHDLIEINLEKQKIKSFNNSEEFSLEHTLEEIELLAKKKINKKTIIFIDEIQEQPIAINRLRYFYEDGDNLKVIAAGSLLEVALEKENFSMPVGRVDYLHIGPMTFTEFLNAKNETILLEQIQNLAKKNSISSTLHKKACEQLKEYFFVGGMPEAIKEYIKNNDKNKVRKIHHSILNTFSDDIPKYSKTNKLLLTTEIYENMPSMVGNDKVIFSQLSQSSAENISQTINLLAKAKIIYKTIHTNCSGLPLMSGSDSSIMKLFHMDIGLYGAMTGLSWEDLFNLSSHELLIKGKLAEQFIAQHLMFRQENPLTPQLFYWLRGKKKGAAEVDFIISIDNTIYPIEVKSGATGKMRSLWQYVAEKKCNTAIRFDLRERDNCKTQVSHTIKTAKGLKKIECTLIGIPLYAVDFINEYL